MKVSQGLKKLEAVHAVAPNLHKLSGTPCTASKDGKLVAKLVRWHNKVRVALRLNVNLFVRMVEGADAVLQRRQPPEMSVAVKFQI